MKSAGLTFPNLVPTWIESEQSVRFEARAGRSRLTFLFSAEALFWLSSRDHTKVDGPQALELFAVLQDLALDIAKQEWERAEGRERTFKIGWLETERFP